MDDGDKARQGEDTSPDFTNSGVQQQECGGSLMKDDAANSNVDGTTLQEASLAAATFEHQPSRKRKGPQTVYKSSFRKRNNEKCRRIQFNEAMDQLTELITQVRSERILGSNASPVSMISNKGELIECTVDVMTRLIEDNQSQKSRIKELERSVLSAHVTAQRPNMLFGGRASDVSATTFPVALRPSAYAQVSRFLDHEFIQTTNHLPTYRHAASEAVMLSNLSRTLLNGVPSPEARFSDGHRGVRALLNRSLTSIRSDQPFAFPPSHQLLPFPDGDSPNHEAAREMITKIMASQLS